MNLCYRSTRQAKFFLLVQKKPRWCKWILKKLKKKYNLEYKPEWEK